MIRTTICTALMLVPGLAFADSEDLRINNITLFEAGLAEINLDAADREEVELTIPLKDIDDVLKSLIVTGDFAARPVIRLSGENPVEDAFMASPVGSGQISDIADILTAIRGTRVALTGLDRSAEGVVMGVSQSASCTSETLCVREVTLLDADGTILRFPLDHADGSDAGVKLKILDEQVVDAMATGLAALAEQSNGKIRTISIELGAGAADAGLSYVVQAPMWKTAYRTLLEDGEDVSLQAWAVIENATPSEWEDVSLTISSGSPVTLSARLHSRQWGARDIYQADNNAGAVRSQNRKALQALSSAGFASADAVESFAASPAPMAELEVATTAVETLTDSRFTFPDKISISSGEMISVPFLAEDLEAERLTVWNGGMGLRSGSPDMILQVDNDLPVRLPAGIMTIHSNESGYVGDASFPMLAPGDEAQVKFGTDTKVTISEKIASRRYERELKISRGVVTLIDEEVTETTYRISAPGVEGRTLMIDHPYRTNVTRKVTGAEGEELIAKPGRREVVRYTV
ncbi:MAG: DUF4139 domain-containing protein, partial [Roseibium sp.]|uniref:DUF4139 domain-containing protein n=1 Tax=Roseibium sp. TaxID=1936156 RepID=UPI0032972C82